MTFTRPQLKRIRQSLRIAIDTEESGIDAYSSPWSRDAKTNAQLRQMRLNIKRFHELLDLIVRELKPKTKKG